MKFLFLIASLLSLVSLWYAEDFPYDMQEPTSYQDFVNSDDSAIKQVAQDYVWEETLEKENPATYYISTTINYFLAILGFIAFLVLAYGFTLVFTDKTDEWIKKWYKFIKMSSIAIIVIGISWLIAIWFINIYATKVAS
jgi:C4-dicarboxylate transporter